MEGTDPAVSNATMLDAILPYMISFGIVNKSCSTNDFQDTDFKDLAAKFKLKISDAKYNRPLSHDQIVKLLFHHIEHLDFRRGGRRAGNLNIAVPLVSPNTERTIVTSQKKKYKELEKNYFGLPPYALNRTAEGIIYHCRKPYDDTEISRGDFVSSKKESDLQLDSSNRMGDKTEQKKVTNHTAQRKVAAALSAMAGNDQMRFHFVYKGGVDAIMKLTYESTDSEVLASCASSIGTVAESLQYSQHLIDKQVIPLISCLIENGDEETRFFAAISLARMSAHEGLDTPLVRAGVIMPIQALLSSTRLDTICFALLRSFSLSLPPASLPSTPSLSLQNIANCMTGSDAESTIRLCLQGCKRLDVIHDFESALFVAKMFTNLSRMQHYVSLLCEEGVLPVLISLLDCQPVSEIVDNCAEAFFNLSMLRKNRRDIHGSGVSSHIAWMLDLGGPQSRAHTLYMVGNLLGSNLLHDKIAREDVLSKIIDLLDPNFREQCMAAAFVLSHCSHNPVAGQVMVFSCEVVPKVLSLLADKANSGMESLSSTYLWTTLTNLAHQEAFCFEIMNEKNIAFILGQEATMGDQQEVIAQLMLNLSEHKELYECVGNTGFSQLVLSFKTLFIRGDSPEIRKTAIWILINLAICIKEARAIILGNDLVDIMEESGLSDSILNHKFIILLYLISCEAEHCPKLVDLGIQRMLMSVVTNATDEGKDIIAAILHNLSLKRALLGTGVLPSLVGFTRNCKSIRVLWVARAIANMSSYPRSRAILAKEKKLVPCLSGVMRTGAQEADRVQHYCALAICNIFTTHLDKLIVEGLIKNGTVVDLVVVTLLRVNSITTKASLGKALFNLLALADFREELVKLDVLEALIELSRIELTELLELSVKTVYNMTCESKKYATKLESLKVPHHMVSRTIINPELHGTRAPTEVKLSCGKAIANMSFVKNLAVALTHEKLAEACQAINNLKSDEARYCAAVSIFNISFLENAIALANSVAVPTLVNILNSGPILCIQLSVASLCNFSLFEVFLDQLTTVALGPLIKAISAPHLDAAIKIDCIYFIYNLVTQFAPSHKTAIEEGVVLALQKIVKVHSDELIIGMVGRILKEICSVESLSRRLLADGVMPIILKLAKYEYPTLKLDLASAVCSLSTPADTSLKMLKLEAVDVLFWLTIHDCLSLYDPIRKYVSRALRNFTIQLEDALYLSKEDRLPSVLKVLVKSTNDDVLWQTSVVIYNMLNPPAVVTMGSDGQVVGGKKAEIFAQECKETLLRRGVIQLIFDLAAVGSESVKHLCSASLHSVADHIPNSDDPAVLQLIMYLLDADGDQFSTVVSRVSNDLLYAQIATPHGTDFTHAATDFAGNWQPMTCEVDTIFRAAVIPLDVSGSDMYSTKPLDNKVITLLPPKIYTGRDFGDFKGESRPSSRANDTTEHSERSSGAPPSAPAASSSSSNNNNNTSGAERRGISPSSHELPTEGRVRFAESQVAVTEFSDDENFNQLKLDTPTLSTPELSARRPGSGSKSASSSPGKQKRDKSGSSSSRKSSTQQMSRQNSKTLPSIIGLNEDKPKVPFDTLKALQGTEYRPKSPKHMINIERSFSNS